MGKIREQILERALELQEQLVQFDNSGPEMRREAAMAYVNMALIYRKLVLFWPHRAQCFAISR